VQVRFVVESDNDVAGFSPQNFGFGQSESIQQCPIVTRQPNGRAV